MGIYYRSDTTRLSFRELWRLSTNVSSFLTACVHKVSRLRAPVSWAIRYDDAITVLPADKVPVHAMRALKPFVEGFQRLGARLAFYQTVSATENLESYFAILLPPEQNAVIVIAWAKARISEPSKESPAICAITSQLQDDTYFSTTNRPSRFTRPPEFRASRWQGATPAELSRRHKGALAESDSAAIPSRDEEDAKEVLLAIKRRNFEWNVNRGVYVLLTTAEQTRLGLPVEEDS